MTTFTVKRDTSGGSLAAMVGGVGIIGTGLVSTVALMAGFFLIMRGIGIKLLWNWFVPLAFANAPHLSLGEAMGIALVSAVAIPSRSSKDSSLWEGPIQVISLVVIGFILHTFFVS